MTSTITSPSDHGRGFAGTTTPRRISDSWGTPPKVFEAAQRWLGLPFNWDVCATRENSMVRDRWFGLDTGINSLKMGWHSSLAWRFGVPVIWMNPPYSDPLPWCRKAAEEAKKGCIVVGLLNNDPSTVWYKDWIEGEGDGVASFILRPRKRLAFLHPETCEPVKGNPKGQILPVWMPMKAVRPHHEWLDVPGL